MSDQRSDRLRDRRRKTSEKAEAVKRAEPDPLGEPDKPDESGKPDEPGKPDLPVKPDSPEKPDEPEETVTPVKQRDDWDPKQIHLPDDLFDRLELQLDETNLQLRRDGDEPLEKLMHWYPMIVEKGLDALDEMDVDDVQEEAKRFE